MKDLASVKQALQIVALVGFASAALCTSSTVVRAQAAYSSYVEPGYTGYVGVGAGFGFTDGAPGEDSGVSVIIAGRQKIGQLPLSLRGQVFLFSGTTAFVPTLSYDLPVGSQSTIYLGGGVALTEGDRPSPVGNRNAFVIQPGIDIGLGNSNTVIFINGVYAVNAYKGNNASAFSLQGGLGLQF
jgi:hypothetical protein